jgi:hypothetical protein
MIVKNRLKLASVFKDYLIVYSSYQKVKYDKEVEALIDSFMRASTALGVRFS